MGKVRIGDVFGRVKVHFAWQAWDLVELAMQEQRTNVCFAPQNTGRWNALHITNYSGCGYMYVMMYVCVCVYACFYNLRSLEN